ncbi:calponin homology domain-containing protein [Paraphysoderma sedebokerense]|nr:calponin homology domain-containing protein [Paraphysoderma sedebokerense]KAI9136269.1 calponin homology domain-containing protein [Paraphysoderma sedebokerense]
MSVPIYGIDKEIKAKIESKLDPVRVEEVRQWLESILNEKITEPDMQVALKDGVKLAKLLNKAIPNSCKVQTSAMPFKQMENINSFLKGAEQLGCPKFELFQTIDLFENKNFPQVIDALYSFSRHAAAKGIKLPLLGPKLAEKHEVTFTEEQLNAGKFIPSMQSGFAGGATPSGVVYGARRQIYDPKLPAPIDETPSQQSGNNLGATPTGVIFGARREIGGVDPGKVKN